MVQLDFSLSLFLSHCVCVCIMQHVKEKGNKKYHRRSTGVLLIYWMCDNEYTCHKENTWAKKKMWLGIKGVIFFTGIMRQ